MKLRAVNVINPVVSFVTPASGLRLEFSILNESIVEAPGFEVLKLISIVYLVFALEDKVENSYSVIVSLAVLIFASCISIIPLAMLL